VKIFLASFMLGCILTACPAAVPGVSCVAEVLSDALKGDSLAQILADAGPTCVTSVEEIITILLGSDDPRVQASPAYQEAAAKRGKK
jgi:hypothetical protein